MHLLKKIFSDLIRLMILVLGPEKFFLKNFLRFFAGAAWSRRLPAL